MSSTTPIANSAESSLVENQLPIFRFPRWRLFPKTDRDNRAIISGAAIKTEGRRSFIAPPDTGWVHL